VIPNDPVPHLYLGVAESERRRFAAAKQHFAKAGDLAVRNPEALPSVVEAFLATKDESIIPAALTAVMELETIDPHLRPKVAAVLNRYSAWPATIKLLEGTARPDLDQSLLLAEAYDHQNLPPRAYEVYAQALAANSSDERVYLSIAAFASQHNNNRYGLQVLDQGIARIPASWRLLLHSGLLLALEGDSAAAEKRFILAGEKSGGSDAPLLALGVLQLESGRLTEAAATFVRAAHQEPGDHNAHYFQALALYRMGEENYSAALPILNRAVAIAPGDAKSHILLGQIYLATGKLDQASTELKKALTQDPENGPALYQLSLVCRRKGQIAEAERYMSAFRKLKASQRENENQLVQILKIVR